jgi:hypothetical protein
MALVIAHPVMQTIASRVAQDSVLRAAMRANPIFAIRTAPWLTQTQRRSLSGYHIEVLRAFAAGSRLDYNATALLGHVGAPSEEFLGRADSPTSARAQGLVIGRAFTTAASHLATVEGFPGTRAWTWSQAHQSAILRDATNNVWNAGCVTGIVVDDNQNIVVATDSGGLWLTSADGSGFPLSDNPECPSADFQAICLGADGPPTFPGHHIIAGAGITNSGTCSNIGTLSDVVLVENDPTLGKSGRPADYLLHWTALNGQPTPSSGAALNIITQVVADAQSRIVVVGTDQGLFSATIPPWNGSARTYSWSPATFSVSAANKYVQSVAIVPGPNPGAMMATSGSAPGPRVIASMNNIIYYGTLDVTGAFYLIPATLLYIDKKTPITGTADFAGFTVASSRHNPNTLYASLSDSNGDFLALFKSTTGGKSWYMVTFGSDANLVYNFRYTDQPTGQSYADSPLQLANTIGGPGGQGNNFRRTNNHVAVSGIDPNTVAIGWRNGFAVSPDSGKTWTGYQSDFFGIHQDVHAVLFAPGPTTGIAGTSETIYVGSDGGLVSLDDYGVTSTYNKGLLNLQFNTPGGGMPGGWSSYGTLGVYPGTKGILGGAPFVGGGTQDNTMVFAAADATGTLDYLVPIETDGDGFSMMFVKSPSPSAEALSTFSSQWPALPTALFSMNGFNGSMRVSGWPYNVGEGQTIGPSVYDPVYTPVVELLKTPSGYGNSVAYAVGAGFSSKTIGQSPCGSAFPNAWSQTISILAATGAGITSPVSAYSSGGTTWGWFALFRVALNQGEYISAIACRDLSSPLFIGTTLGRMMVFTSPLSLVPKVPPVGTFQVTSGASAPVTVSTTLLSPWTVARIVVDSWGNAFAAINWNGASSTARGSGAILRYTGGQWQDMGAPSYGGNYYSLDVGDDGSVYAVADAGVIASSSRGTSWTPIDQGLPLNVHGADIRFTRDGNGNAHLFLSTYGRSIWRASLGTTGVGIVKPPSNYYTKPPFPPAGPGDPAPMPSLAGRVRVAG